VKNNQKNKLGFSLIELSVGILVIGILVIGVSQGSGLVKAAKIKSAQSLTKGSPVNSMEGLRMWLETTLDESFDSYQKIDTAIGSVGTITAWNDVNPQEFPRKNATQTGASTTLPRYIENGMNGLPTINFDGASGANGDYLNFDGSFLANNDYTIFIVEQRRLVGPGFFVGGVVGGPKNGHLQLGYGNVGNTLLFDPWSLNSFFVATPQFSAITPKIHSYRHGSVSGMNYHIDSSLQTMSCESGVSCQSPTTHMISFDGAAIGQSSGRYFKGDVAEIIMFTKYLKNSDRVDVENYLKSKWGIK
jgi:prepilin-type N-terminal cleavage/methylation domain-containing protein